MRLLLIGLLSVLLVSCNNKVVKNNTFTFIKTNRSNEGKELSIQFYKGANHNHPTLAVWLEDLEGNFLQNLYVTQYVGTGVYQFNSTAPRKWENKPGANVWPATLPYWLHKKGPVNDEGDLMPSPQYPMPDAITSATPPGSFILKSKADLPLKFRVMMEVNQTWDWNSYWNNDKYPDNVNYKSSCQPALVYSVTVDLDDEQSEYFLNPIGHSHFAGEDGTLYTDLTTFTTALDIFSKVVVTFKSEE